ncbi:MAG: Hsp20/alpha crystallin family protein [Bacteroidales bacterium]|nr:Hsp20/alpha crystallin family protein [Bacteroidales bacterium]MDD4671102.1 Hsp20/alpha crystallin family protein [Bacteroidales bacterium]
MVPTMRKAQNWLPGIFNDFFDYDGFGKLVNTTSPAINVIENEKEYKVELAAPGMSKEDFKILINEDNQLVVSMEKKEEQKEGKKNEKYLRREFSYSKFEQALLLPEDIKKDEIEASMNHGVLNITIPKNTEVQALPKQRLIEIK